MDTISDEEWERLSQCSEDWQLVDDDNTSCSSWAILPEAKGGEGSSAGTPLRTPSPSPSLGGVPGRVPPMLKGVQVRMRIHAATVVFRLRNVGRKGIRRAERRKVTRRIERSFPETKGAEKDDYFFGIYGHVFNRIKGWENRVPAPKTNSSLAVRKKNKSHGSDSDSNSPRKDAEEEKEKARASDLPYFGFGSTSLEQVDEFYRAWESFVSTRSFEECDKWLVTPGRDRATRRLMQRDNQKLRASGRREFHGLVSSFLRFVKARDPRVRRIREIRQRVSLKAQLRKIQKQEEKQARRERAREAAWEEERKWMKEASVLRAIRYSGVAGGLPIVDE
mmetsp:Transcript_7482/g.14629  ORF Transcript_7482/g.14629 Transcript_7482/m.14629 type:complete len:335 (-) Transcript_7482:549-1553(-)